MQYLCAPTMTDLTHSVLLHPRDFMWLNIRLYLKRRWYLLAVILGAAAATFILQPNGYAKYVLLLAAVWYLLVIIFGFAKQSKTAAAAGQLQSRKYSLAGDTLHTTYANGEEFATQRTDIVHLDIIAKTYLLFISPNAYIFVPLSGFVNEEAHERFKQWLYFS